jgi:hypothetical protein
MVTGKQQGGSDMKFSATISKSEVASFLEFNEKLKSKVVLGKTGARYQAIDSATVIGAVERVAAERGLTIQSVRGSAAARKSTKHVIRVRFDQIQGYGKNQYFPEIVIFNSYDGEQTLRISTGMYRLVCSNGLTVGESISEHVRIKHVVGPKSLEFIKNLEFQIAACVDRLASMGAAVTRLQSKVLTATQEEKIVESLKLPKRAAAQLQVIRGGALGRDHEMDLWAFYNAVNEALRIKSRSEVGNEFRNVNLAGQIESAYEMAKAA